MPTAQAAQGQVAGSLRLPRHSSPVAALQLDVSMVQAGQRLPLWQGSVESACGVRGRPCRQR